MKKKLISSGIMLFILGYVLIAGFLIIKISFTNGYSNAQLIANFFIPRTPPSSVSIAHLADATSTAIPPAHQPQLSIGSYAEISPIATATNNTNATTKIISSTVNTPDASITEQTLEVLAATLIHLEMSSTTALK